MVAVDIRPLDRATLLDRLDGIAQLRITVFRDWPYLYDGDMDYERAYLRAYTDNPGAYVAAVFDGEGQIVGMCTASPLAEHHEEFAEPLRAAGHNPARWFYFGESVLLPSFRGQGIGVRFFELREAEARRQGFDRCLFTAVRRPDDHPAKPADAVSLDSFWRNRGYAPLDGVETTFSWRDIGDSGETPKRMDYWHRHL